jgi:tagaturonate reductase
LLDLAIQNALEPVFIDWLIHHNEFCSSLVDRIVPGKLPAAEQARTTALLGYEDDLMIMAETYRLWAIESDNEHVKEILSFAEADEGVVIAPDIQIFRELKLRILNGSHTLSCGLAHLAGFRIVKEAMADASFNQYVETLMMNEIIPVITNESLPVSMAQDFAKKVLDRYRNPYIEHQWLSITMQYSSKINMRDTPLLLKYIELFQHPPVYMSLGWAAHLLFMRSTPGDDGQYYGEINGKKYLVNDNQAAYYSDQWKDPQRVVSAILSNTALWGTDLSQLPGFVEIVQKNLDLLQSEGAASVLKQLTH